jgi:hypothetical protein
MMARKLAEMCKELYDVKKTEIRSEMRDVICLIIFLVFRILLPNVRDRMPNALYSFLSFSPSFNLLKPSGNFTYHRV